MIDPSELTNEQTKAFKQLVRALKKCESENIFWYQVLETLYPLNGNVVESVEEGISTSTPNAFPLDERCGTESVTLTGAWADDTHYAIIKE